MNMRYLKTFEGFKINENQSSEEVVKQKIESLSPEEKEKLTSELNNLATKLGLSAEEMTDTEKVAAALAEKQGELKESVINEGIGQDIKEWWGRVKNSFYKWLTRIGVGGVILSIASAAIGAEMQSQATNLADYVPDATVNPNAAVVIGGVAFVISTAALILGMQKYDPKKDIK